jgi:hypothetical protein
MASDMLAKDEFLFPYLWAQRQFRQDQYQMASAAQLEDLFFDTLGAYVNHYVPGEQFSRRQGSEPWDYTFAGLELSHKEGIMPGLTAVWQPGEGRGNRSVRYENWDFPHPVVFVYTPKSVSAGWAAQLRYEDGNLRRRKGKIWQVSHDSLSRSSLSEAPILFGRLKGSRLEVEQVFSRSTWDAFSVHDLRAMVGQPRRSDADFWIDRPGKTTGIGDVDADGLMLPAQLELDKKPLMPGLYLFPADELSNVPLTSNNKAHFLSRDLVQQLMRNAEESGRFIQLPLWPMEFADVTPPNLYAQQRRRYDEFMAARSRNVSP